MNETVHEQIDAVEQFMFAHMSKEAVERYGRIKAFDVDRALSALLLGMQDVKAGKYQRLLDQQLKTLLQRVSHGNSK